MSSSSSLANPTPYQLYQRTLVLDYLCHSCYTKTARAFDRESTVRPLDADGDEITETEESSINSTGSGERFESLLKQVGLRKEIRTQILCGKVDQAINLLNKHFPAVLSENMVTPVTDNNTRPPTNNLEYVSSTSTEPSHLFLNLRILAFSEACRTIPLEYPPQTDSRDTSETLTTDSTGPVEGEDQQQMDLLVRAQKLYAFSNTLPNPADRVTYLKELENVGGLLAYKVPEKSSMAKYLTLERREAVADQINRAILKSTGNRLISSVELATRYTHLLWQAAHQNEVKPRSGSVLPPRGSKTAGQNESDIVPTFDLHQFIESKP